MVIEDNDKVPKITREVIRAVPGSKLGRHYGNELSFILPQDDESVEHFANLFKLVSIFICQQRSRIPWSDMIIKYLKSKLLFQREETLGGKPTYGKFHMFNGFYF